METTQFCECCGKPLDPSKLVMLELDQRTWTYHDFGDVPDEFSQGWFTFGATCARKKIAAAKAARKDA